MTLILVPPGRGRWSQLPVTIPGTSKHGPLPIEVRVGMPWMIDGKVFRVSKVLP